LNVLYANPKILKMTSAPDAVPTYLITALITLQAQKMTAALQTSAAADFVRCAASLRTFISEGFWIPGKRCRVGSGLILRRLEKKISRKIYKYTNIIIYKL
jgi:hypothetical protein